MSLESTWPSDPSVDFVLCALRTDGPTNNKTLPKVRKIWGQKIYSNKKIGCLFFSHYFSTNMCRKGWCSGLEMGLRRNSWFPKNISISCGKDLVQIPCGNSERKLTFCSSH